MGDFAGIVKCLYSLHDRIALCDAAQGIKGETGSTEPADADGQQVYNEEEQVHLETLLTNDPVMNEHAGKAVVLNYLQRSDLFDACSAKSDFQDKLKSINEKAAATKLIAATVRKSIKEVQSMIKAC